MQRVELSSSFRMLIFFVGGSLLGGALVRFPLNPFDGRIWLCLLLGVAPTLSPGREFMYRYLAVWLTLAGAGGLVWLVGDRLEPLFGHSSYLRGNSSSPLVAGVFYLLLLIAGLLTMRIVRKHATRPVKAVN